MGYHILAFFLGFLLDLLFGDPYFLPHPIRLIGKLISVTEKKLRRHSKISCNGVDRQRTELLRGVILVILVLLGTVAATALALSAAYWLHPWLGAAAETVMTYQILAAKCLKAESMKVCQYLRQGNTGEARKAVAMIVGRDTACLDAEGIAKAAVETVAENTSDGVIAPLLYTALGGPILGLTYKAINTMDSMVGYRNEEYLYFGRAAAKLDDCANFIPARLSAYLMIAASFLLGHKYSGKQAWAVWKRDRKKHASPNSAQTEAVCAGSLGIMLAGPAVYFGKPLKKPYIGDSLRKTEAEDIRRANRLMYMAAWLCELICLSVMLSLWKICGI